MSARENLDVIVDPHRLREKVKKKYREVAIAPDADYHFHTGRPLAKRLGYDDIIVKLMPDAAVESFAGVGNPFSLRSLNQVSGSSTSVQVRASIASSLRIRLHQPAASSASI